MPKAIAPPTAMVSSPLEYAAELFCSTIYLMVLYAVIPGTRGNIPGIENCTAGVLSFLAINSLYMPTMKDPEKDAITGLFVYLYIIR